MFAPQPKPTLDLISAIGERNLNATRFLLEKGVKLNLSIKQRYLIFRGICTEGNLVLLRLLLKYEQKNRTKKTKW